MAYLLQGMGRAATLTDEQRVFYENHKKLLQGAKRRKLAVSITRKQVYKMFSEQCVYCGTTDSRRTYPNSKWSGRTIAYAMCNGIDRLDNTIGYVNGNVATCCARCNKAKSNLAFCEWVTWIQRLVSFQKAHPIGESDIHVRYDVSGC